MNRRVAIVTGTRAEFGLLRSTIEAIKDHPALESRVVAGGAHLLSPARTIDEVRAAFPVAAEVTMQRDGEHGRDADAMALGRGVSGFASVFHELDPAAVVVLGDRIEALAAAAAASVGGRRVVHLHGGDRAEGVADEAMRHAITRLAHLHLAATEESADRLRRTGEDVATVLVVGSPAVDGLAAIEPLDDASFFALGRPRTIVLHHGCGLAPEVEAAWIDAALGAAIAFGPTLVLAPNADPGSEVVRARIDAFMEDSDGAIERRDHLPRPVFVAALRRVAALVGNSSAGLIEAAVLGCPTVNLGPRQAGRERPPGVIDVATPDVDAVLAACESAAQSDRTPVHPYGDPGCGARIAEAVASLLDGANDPPRKRLAY